jgi:hypothetical protein
MAGLLLITVHLVLTWVPVPDAIILPQPKESVRANMFVCLQIKRYQRERLDLVHLVRVLSPAPSLPFRQHSLALAPFLSTCHFHFHHHHLTRKQHTPPP